MIEYTPSKKPEYRKKGDLQEFSCTPINISSRLCFIAGEAAKAYTLRCTPRMLEKNEISVIKEPVQAGYPDELKLGEILSDGIPFLIPKRYLFSRQRNDEYDKKKRASAENEFRKEGIRFLLKNPIITTYLPIKNGMQLIIIDGHHRARYANQFGIKDIPGLMYSPGQLVDAFNITYKKELNETSLIAMLEKEVSEADASFMNATYQPELIRDIKSPQDLPFARFTINSA